MAHEELMGELPEGFERVSERGPFLVNLRNHTVEVRNPVLVTCGGPDGIPHARELAQALNDTWSAKMEEFNRRQTAKSQ